MTGNAVEILVKETVGIATVIVMMIVMTITVIVADREPER